MRKLTLALVAAMAVVAIGDLTFGSGFSIYEQGAKASAEAGAFTARADDPTAIFYNPAGITQLEGTQLYLGATAITLDGKFVSSRTRQRDDMNSQLLGIGNLYVTHRFGERTSIGLGIFSPFGLKTIWKDDFEGRYLARDSELKTLFLNPTFAFQVTKEFSFAVGANYATADVKLSRNIDFSALGAKDGFLSLNDTTSAWAGNAALRFTAENGFSWGISYRDKVKLNFDNAKAKFRNTPAIADALFCGGQDCFPDQRASSKVTLPRVISFGVGRAGEKWTLEGDIVHHDWKSFENLEVDFEHNTPLLLDTSQPETWDSTLSVRVGGSRKLNDNYEFRFGAYYDVNPIPDQNLRPLVPDSDRESVQFGYGYKSDSGKFHLDMFYQALYFKPNSTSRQAERLNGKYTSFANILGFGASWRLQ